jgi:hypothetical protein
MSRLEASLTRNTGLAAGALLASSATLVCCVLPAVLVSLGAGATLAGLVSAVPQLIWLSEHKLIVFGSAGALLGVSGVAIWYGRNLPCPADPVAARACRGLAALPRCSTASHSPASPWVSYLLSRYRL